MAKALPKASGLRILGNLGSARGLDLQFKPSISIVAGSIDKLGLDIRSFKEPLKRSLVQVIIPSIQDNFHAEGRPKWQELADSTIYKKGFTNILLDSGKLFKTMQRQNIWTLNRNYLILTDLPDKVWYGKVHQAGATFSVRGGGMNLKAAEKYLYGGAGKGKGGSGGSGTIPARPFVMLQKIDERRIESIFRHWLDERMRATARRIN
jgi:phage gpG-like protein